MLDKSSASQVYKTNQHKKFGFLWISIIVVLLLIVFGLTVGAKNITIAEVLSSIISSEQSTQKLIIIDLRLPRLIAAVVSGATLGIAGAIMQIVLRNPLGSPFTLGISNASAFGAAMAYIFMSSIAIKGLGAFGQHIIVSVSAFVWAAIGSLFILFVARKKGASPENMILAGIIINTLFMALTSVLQFLADDVQLGSIVFWTFGDLSKSSWPILGIQLLIIVPALIYLIKNSAKYNALDAGDQVANNLGINVHKFRMISILLTALLTASIVAFYGIIAFIGLVIPHAVRMTMGNESRFLIIASMVFGSLFLLCSDLLARSLFSPIVIPVGIITSIVGAPLFIILVLKGSNRWSK